MTARCGLRVIAVALLGTILGGCVPAAVGSASPAPPSRPPGLPDQIARSTPPSLPPVSAATPAPPADRPDTSGSNSGAFGPRVDIDFVAEHETAVSEIPRSVDDRAWEPVVATHPSDPDRIAVVYEHRGPGAACSTNPLIRISRNGGLTWRSTAASPSAGSGRGVGIHAAIAWGPGPAGNDRLYWANMTTPRCGDGRFSLSTTYSDDEGATWSKLRVERETPAWVGGFPDIAVDRDLASPNHGTVYVGYNWLAPGANGPGFHLLASADFGATWAATEIAPAPGPRGYGDWWRIGYRLRPAGDGSVYASWYQANLRRWDRENIFARGGSANVGRLGIAVARIVFEPAGATFAVGPSRIGLEIPETPYTTSSANAPGTAGNIRPDPVFLHGFDVDPITGRLYIAVGTYGAANAGTPRGVIRFGRSDDGGETWTESQVPAAADVDGRVQSSIRPNVVAGLGSVLVTMRTLDDTAKAATIGSSFTFSTDGGVTWRDPIVVSATRWRASNLGGVPNGMGLRERAERLSDGSVFWAYGDGRYAAAAKAGRVAIVGALIRIESRLIGGSPIRDRHPL